MGIKPNKLELNKILWDELTISIRDYFNTRYANTKISDKAKNDLIKGGVSNAVVYWNLQANKEAKTIGRNPKKEIAKKRLNILRQRSDSNERIIKAVANYIAMEFEHYMNLGHTDAYAYLCDIDEPILIDEFITPTPFETFEFSGDINHLFKQCIEYKVIDSKTSLDSFKMAFNGNDLRGFNDFVFKFKQHNHCVYFFDQLNNKKLINYKFVQNNRIIEHLGNIKNVHSKRDNYKNSKSGTPKGIEYINDLINSLK